MNEMKLPGFICIVAQAFYRCQESCSIVLESLKLSGATPCGPFPQGIPHVASGEVAERSEDGKGRHVKKICQWHIFLTCRLSGYAAVASFLVCTASSFSVDLSGYILSRFPKFRSGI